MRSYIGSFGEVNAAQDLQELVYFLDAAAAGTKFSLKAAQSQAAERVYVIQGNGSVDLSSAEATGLIENQLSAALDTERVYLSTGLQTYFTNIPAAADGAEAIAFAFGGIDFQDVLSVEIEWTTEGTSAANSSTVLKRFAPVLINTPALNGSNALLEDDGSTAIAYGTDNLVAFPKYNLIFGAFTIPDIADVPAASVPVKVTIITK